MLIIFVYQYDYFILNYGISTNQQNKMIEKTSIIKFVLEFVEIKQLVISLTLRS
jgi:hypothetical protein